MLSVSAQAQKPSKAEAGPAKATAIVPRTPDGHPDFQGLWDYRTVTPLERPRDLAEKEFFTDEEALAFEKRNAQRLDNVVAVHPPGWLDYGSKTLADRRSGRDGRSEERRVGKECRARRWP